MIGALVAGGRVDEERQATSMEHRPASEVAEALRRERQLAASARVRTHGALVKAADGRAEALLRLRREGARGTDFVGVEIDVGVEVQDLRHDR